jgi:hypothetical protein
MAILLEGHKVPRLAFSLYGSELQQYFGSMMLQLLHCLKYELYAGATKA